MLRTGLVALLVLATPVWAETAASIRDRRPDLFHPETGLRIARQRAPTPEDIPAPAIVVDADETADLLEVGALALDVFGALQSRFDELEGTWLVRGPRDSLPGAVWLPEVGRGILDATMERYLRDNLLRLTDANMNRPIVVFCVADCWMSWNAAQRIALYGYTQVYWFRLGTDGWLDTGRTLMPTDPVPVDVD